MSLRGRTIFITGASRGIGHAIAMRAAADGANVVIAAKTTEPHPKLPGTIHTAAADVERAGGKALAVATDIRDEAQVEAAVAAAVERFGGIDILVNNASAISLTGTLATPMKRFDLMHQINLPADDNRAIGRALERGPAVAGGIDLGGDAEAGELAVEPLTCLPPHRSPRQSLRAVGGGGECRQLAEVGHDILCAHNGEYIHGFHGCTPLAPPA